MVGAPVFEGRNVWLQVQFLGKEANETQFVSRGQCSGIGKDFGKRHGERMCHKAIASPINSTPRIQKHSMSLPVSSTFIATVSARPPVPNRTKLKKRADTDLLSMITS